jgi:plasmid stabilization system protein ParE
VESSVYAGLIGVDRSAFKIGIRSFAYRNRIIFFTISDTELIVVRVLHGHQDISPDLFIEQED